MLSSTLSKRVIARRSAVRCKSSAVDPPTQQQLWRAFGHAAIPMFGFGLMDQTVMLQAGHAIDCSIGVAFSLSTLTAAAMGQVCSDASGVLFGGTLESLASRAGFPQAGLTTAQRALPVVKRIQLAGSFCGVILGCLVGLGNLALIDTERSSHLKLNASESELKFEIESSNAIRDNATTLIVRGPDVDGLLASMTAALAVRGCSLVELHAMPRTVGDRNEQNSGDIEDIFHIVKRETGEPFDDCELEELAQGLLESTKTPMNAFAAKKKVHELENTNSSLQDKVQKLEKLVYEDEPVMEIQCLP